MLGAAYFLSEREIVFRFCGLIPPSSPRHQLSAFLGAGGAAPHNHNNGRGLE